ncbi:MAG: hypothetical protein COY04_00570 [Parcubacteria group bacterium CG_4_10_14_0_2_um_filter_7_35_8]|nr:MAG: hypothetical protein COU70_00510 [Parcubacteria group bacterium CG10_big_fil_rev_8_21_14_0_10_35_15]PIZ77097.1 MAG: hypothetical protein COY04_00570 [Parcubacteria group bacterium CG_4_10_14_0_2_um_filter_7_35_8]
MLKKIKIKPIHIFIIAPIVLALSFFVINYRNNILKEALAAPKTLHPLTFYCDLDEDLVNFTKEKMETSIHDLEMEKYFNIGAPPGGSPPIDPPPPSTGFFSLPMNNACVTCPYEGYMYSSGNCHEGADFDGSGTPVGAPIYNVAPGIIKGWGLSSLYGYWVAIEHSYTLPGNPSPTTLISFYAHMIELPTSEVQTAGVGGSIDRGIYIGRMGNTGNSHGAHLHFALLTTMEINGQEPWPRYIYSVNPEEYLPTDGLGQCVILPACGGCH